MSLTPPLSRHQGSFFPSKRPATTPSTPAPPHPSQATYPGSSLAGRPFTGLSYPGLPFTEASSHIPSSAQPRRMVRLSLAPGLALATQQNDHPILSREPSPISKNRSPVSKNRSPEPRLGSYGGEKGRDVEGSGETDSLAVVFARSGHIDWAEVRYSCVTS